MDRELIEKALADGEVATKLVTLVLEYRQLAHDKFVEVAGREPTEEELFTLVDVAEQRAEETLDRMATGAFA